MVGPLAGMRHFMPFETLLQREAFPALLALVGIFSGVHHSVGVETLFPLKALSAHVVVKVRSVTVNLLVDFYVRL